MRRSRTLAVLTLSLAVGAGLPVTVSAGPLICDPYYAWTTINSESTKVWASSDDSIVWHAPSSASLTVTSDLTATSSRSATRTTTSGTATSVGVTVGWFNASHGWNSSDANAMETSDSWTKSVTTNITIPAGHSMLQFVGFQITTASMTRKQCSSNGQTITTVWSGTLVGPRLRAAGYIDCQDTSLC